MTSGSTCPAAMPVESRSSTDTSRRFQRARTRHAGLQWSCVARVWRYGLPQPRHARGLTPCNAWDLRSGLRLPISQPFASNPAQGGWQAGRRRISYYRPLPGGSGTVKSKWCSAGGTRTMRVGAAVASARRWAATARAMVATGCAQHCAQLLSEVGRSAPDAIKGTRRIRQQNVKDSARFRSSLCP